MSAQRWFALAVFLGTATGQNATPPSSAVQANAPQKQLRTENQAKPDLEVRAIADGALALAPEFGSDVLIRLSESSRVSDQAMKLNLLEQAFYLAAQVDTPVRPGTSAFSPDTRSGYLALAFRQLQLDRLSLQSRVVSKMLPFDAGKARALFEEIRFPTLAPVDCAEPLTYDVSLFYKTAGQVVHDAFSAKEKLKDLHLALIEPYVGTLQSHTQVRPAAELLLTADLSPADLGQLVNTFAVALSQLRGDERSFAAANAVSEFSSLGAIAKLITALDARGVPSTALLSALREYLVSNFSGLRCGETIAVDSANSSLPEAVVSFNQQFRLALQNARIAPISDRELEDATIGPKETLVHFWQSPEAKRLFTDEHRLNFGSRDRPLLASEKTTPEWSAELADLLSELDAWSPNSESPVDFFAEKSLLYLFTKA
jgi:hypothetical protein